MNFLKKRPKIFFNIALFLAAFALLSAFSFAHEETVESFHDNAKQMSVWVVFAASVIIAIFVIASILIKKKSEALKLVLVIGIIAPSILTTIYIAGSTIYLNSVSETKGPVHWHADFEIWDCGEKIDLVNPKGLLNRVGTATFHEHGDDRMHVEGTIYKKSSIDLHSFFEVVNGQLENDYFAVPTDNGIAQMRNGQKCGEEEGKLQAFLYRIKNPNAYSKSGFVYEQVKLENFEDHILAPYINIPPGDCIILEFGPEKDFTDRICESYKVAILRGDIEQG